MYINTIVYANIVPFFGLLFLTILIKVNPLFDKKQNNLFLQTAYITFVMLIVISIDYLLSAQTFSDLWMIRRFTSFLNFAVSPYILLCMIKIISNKRLSIFLHISFWSNFILCFASLFANIIFTVDRGNSYTRGPLFFIPFCTSICYIGVLINESVKKRKNNSYEIKFLIVVILILCFGMYLEIAKHYHFLTWDFIALCLTMYYLLLNINQSMLDHLTKTYNRAMYNQKIQNINQNSSCVIAVIDLNGFKKINDLYGHEEGDKCLIKFVEILQKNIDTKKKDMLYRVGGDEFTIISISSSVELENRLKNCLMELKEHNLSFSYGIKEYESTKNIEEIVNEADKLMYINKSYYKSLENSYSEEI